MREILFRAKRTDNGEWVYGDFVSNGFGICHTEYLNEYGDVGDIYHQVMPTTISQFTGLIDKNGRQIFEGDIVRYMQNNTMVVVWNNESAAFVGAYSAINFNYCATLINGHMYLEVIGNIYDNPELLE